MKKSLVLVAVTLLFVSCNEDPVSTNNHNSTANPFIGKWVELFDTTADAKFTKEQKLAYWYLGDFTGWIKPDTITFMNDSVLENDLRYWYDSTKIYATDLVQYDGIKYDTNHLYYKFSSKDSLYIYLDPAVFDTGYIPPHVKIR